MIATEPIAAQVKALSLNPGDLVVVQADEPCDMESLAGALRSARESIPDGVHVLVVNGARVHRHEPAVLEALAWAHYWISTHGIVPTAESEDQDELPNWQVLHRIVKASGLSYRTGDVR